jgi:NAD-dependent dihydropyrimidine dehydrogenase PreA subunit
VVQRAEAALVQDRGHFPLDPASPDVTLYRHALAIRRQFVWGSLLFGAWVGLLVGWKLLGLSLRRQRTEYEIDQAACLACGRCYQVCPIERAELPPGMSSPGAGSA